MTLETMCIHAIVLTMALLGLLAMLESRNER